MQLKLLLRVPARNFHISYGKSVASVNNILNEGQNEIQTQAQAHEHKLKMSGWQIHNYGDFDELLFSDRLKVPQIKQSNEILLKVQATSINPIDVAMLGGYGSAVLKVLRCQPNAIEFPLTLGREFCGTLIQNGMSVNNFKLPVGQRVWGVVPVQSTQGAHAQYVRVPDYCVGMVPEILTNAEASSVLYAGLTAWSGIYLTAQLGGVCGALTADGGGANKRVLVLGGSGAVGSLAIQILRAQGSQVLATCSENATELVQNLGADCVIDYRNPSKMATLRNFAPYDLVLDCSGQGSEAAETLDFKYDQYVTFSSPLLRNIDSSGVGLGLLKNFANILEANVKSLTNSKGLIKYGFFIPAPQGIELLKQLVERKKLLPLIDSCYKFEELPEAFKRVKAGHLRGKVVVTLD
uniref:Enoyl reductase (ER) domain-containing protein n=1 Tax=Glossina palpalis gambiensis TaxID=67801 RepID=A0A1B0BRP7_9MUSC